jgi:capsular polysaccharide biosynthesis protein
LESDLFAYLRAIIRWSWVTLILVAATVGVIIYTSADVPVVYTSTVKLQVTPPEPDDVTLYTPSRPGTSREEITAQQNNFSGVARGLAVAAITVKQLGLSMSAQELADRVVTEIPAFSDFVYVHVSADNPNDAQAIARVHTQNSLTYFGQARAQATTARKQFVTEQLLTATADLNAARAAIFRFQTKNGTVDLNRDIQGYQDTLRSLSVDRDRDTVEIERATSAATFYLAQAQKATVDGDNVGAAGYRVSAAANQATAEGMRSAVIRLNELIAQRQSEMFSLQSLTTENDRLQGELQRAQSTYNFLQGKRSEAEVKETDALNVSFMQVVEQANMPARPEKVQTKNLLIPGVAASVIGGVILSFVLEYLFMRGRRRRQQT